VNEVDLHVDDDLIKWLDYKPTRGDDELLNLLVLDLFEDINMPPVELFKVPEKQPLHQQPNVRLSSSKQNRKSNQTTHPNHRLNKHQHNLVSSKLVERPPQLIQQHHPTKLSAQSSLTSLTSTAATTTTAKPTLFDTYYDLVKSVHLQISVRPINVNFRTTRSDEKLEINLPQIDIKSSGTKCDLEEELMGVGRLVELPCTFLRACEKTSNKLPWLVEFNNLSVAVVNQSREYLVHNIDLNVLFAVKPKYHQYDNLLSSLGFYLHVDWLKKCDLNVRNSHVEFFMLLVSKLVTTFGDLAFKIDYAELDTKYNLNFRYY
jgi:hypothetical protein